MLVVLRLQTCLEAILHRDLGYSWVNLVRLASVRMAPLDVNLDMALVEALLEMSARITELVEVSELIGSEGNGNKRCVRHGLHVYILLTCVKTSILVAPTVFRGFADCRL